jgi:hypothetical protein
VLQKTGLECRCVDRRCIKYIDPFEDDVKGLHLDPELRHSNTDAFGMSVQSLDLGQRDDRGSQILEALGRQFLTCDVLLKRPRIHAAVHLCEAVRGQSLKNRQSREGKSVLRRYVIRSRGIIPTGYRTPSPHKHAPRILN